MVLCILKFDINSDKMAAYVDWSKKVIPEVQAIPGLVEFCGYRQIAGSSMVMMTFEFASLADFAAWRSNAATTRLTNERRAFTMNETTEVWETSPLTPTPLRGNS